MVTNHTTGKNFDNLLNFGKKDAFTVQNIRNFNHLYIARFEVSLKYVVINASDKTLLHRELKFANAENIKY